MWILYINFGLAPCFQEELVHDIKKSPFHSILCDKYMNKILQMEQMDPHINYWCDGNNKVKTNYFDSQFLRCANADNIVAAIEAALNIGYKILLD